MTDVQLELAEARPFGDHRQIQQLTAARYAELLAVVAPHVPAAQTLADAVSERADDAILLDTLVRRTVEDGVLATVEGLPTIDEETLDELLLATAAASRSGASALLPLHSECLPLPSAPGPAVVWADQEAATTAARRFVDEVAKRMPGFTMVPPTPEQLALLDDGLALAQEVAPALARSALSHLRLVVLGDFPAGHPPLQALTVPGLSGVIFVSPSSLGSRAAVAESLVHECVHLKFLDLEYVDAFFPEGFRPLTSPRITPAWHKNATNGGWPLDRLLTSMQVYTTLSVLFTVAKQGHHEGFYTPEECEAHLERCLTRAAWLHGTSQELLDHLAPAGRDFVAWLGGIVGRLQQQTHALA